jgi:hypothetical protein
VTLSEVIDELDRLDDGDTIYTEAPVGSARAADRTGMGGGREPAAPARDPAPVPCPEGGYIGLDTWRTRDWYPALEAAGIGKRGPYHLRHTFATEALAAGVSIFELARLMGCSVEVIDDTYGHLARDSEDVIRARLDARSARSGHVQATVGEDGPDG